MKKIKLFIAGLLLIALANITFVCKVYANVKDDASAKGFTVSDAWENVGCDYYDAQKFGGSKYNYGTMWSWFAVFKYYDSLENSMYVLALSEVEGQPNFNSYWDQKRWNLKQMSTKFKMNDATLLSYAPKATETTGDVTNSVSLGIGVSNGENPSVNTSVQFTESYSTSEITVTSTKTSNNEIKINHNFIRYNKNTSKNSVCCSHVTKLNAALFKIAKYNSNTEYRLEIINYVSVYRYGLINSATIGDNQTMTYTI